MTNDEQEQGREAEIRERAAMNTVLSMDSRWLLAQLDSARVREAALRSALKYAIGFIDNNCGHRYQHTEAYRQARLLLSAAAPAEAGREEGGE